ncbi:hypothetical protein U1Q18_036834 [Sarracenia purpurea var. burkii]
MVVISLSSVLGEDGKPETVLEALSHCLEQTCSPSFRHIGGLQCGLVVLDDVLSLLSLRGTVLVCLLCHLRRLIQTAKGELKSEQPRKSKRVEVRRKLKIAERKTYFIMCWVHEQPGKAWSSLSTMMKAEKLSALEFVGHRGKTMRRENKKRNQ